MGIQSSNSLTLDTSKKVISAPFRYSPTLFKQPMDSGLSGMHPIQTLIGAEAKTAFSYQLPDGNHAVTYESGVTSQIEGHRVYNRAVISVDSHEVIATYTSSDTLSYALQDSSLTYVQHDIQAFCILGDNVIELGGDGRVRSFSLTTHALNWTYQAGPDESSTVYGITVYDGGLYCLVGLDDGGHLIAVQQVNATTGATIGSHFVLPGAGEDYVTPYGIYSSNAGVVFLLYTPATSTCVISVRNPSAWATELGSVTLGANPPGDMLSKRFIYSPVNNSLLVNMEWIANNYGYLTPTRRSWWVDLTNYTGKRVADERGDGSIGGIPLSNGDLLGVGNQKVLLLSDTAYPGLRAFSKVNPNPNKNDAIAPGIYPENQHPFAVPVLPFLSNATLFYGLTPSGSPADYFLEVSGSGAGMTTSFYPADEGGIYNPGAAAAYTIATGNKVAGMTSCFAIDDYLIAQGTGGAPYPIYLFKISTGQEISLSTPITMRQGSGYLRYHNGTIYILAPRASGGSATDLAYSIDAATGTVTTLPTLPSALDSGSSLYLACPSLLVDGRPLYVNRTNNSIVYLSASNTWVDSGGIPTDTDDSEFANAVAGVTIGDVAYLFVKDNVFSASGGGYAAYRVFAYDTTTPSVNAVQVGDIIYDDAVNTGYRIAPNIHMFGNTMIVGDGATIPY